MKTLIIYVMRALLSLIYGILKLFPTQDNKVIFLSRQDNVLSLDFRLVEKKLVEKKPAAVKIVSICHRLEGNNLRGALGFGITTLKSMYHLATAKVCVLDAYWPAVSLLKHKQTLKIIQMWHALGKIKQSGYQTLDKEGGRGKTTARLMKMHKGYDYVIAGGKAWNPYYVKSFGISEEKIRNYGLPRIDYLIEKHKETKDRILTVYPEFREKKIVLYAPTFRRNIQLKWESLYENLILKAKTKDYILVVKGHPNQNIRLTEEMAMAGVKTCPDFKAVDLLSVADYLVTDYSAIALEGAVLNIPTLYFLYDVEEYRQKNGMNIDLYKEMPKCVFTEGSEVSGVVMSGTYNYQALENYVAKFLPEDLGKSTDKITDLILECMENHN